MNGKGLESLRQHEGLTQKQMAEDMGISMGYYKTLIYRDKGKHQVPDKYKDVLATKLNKPNNKLTKPIETEVDSGTYTQEDVHAALDVVTSFEDSLQSLSDGQQRLAISVLEDRLHNLGPM